MAFTRPTYSVTNIQELPTIIKGEATAVKQIFDKASLDIKGYLESLLAEIESNTAGASGAHNTGSAAIAGVTGTTVASQIANLKAQIDAAVIGTIPDASITIEKIGFEVATPDELDAVETAYQAVDTEIRHRIFMGV